MSELNIDVNEGDYDLSERVSPAEAKEIINDRIMSMLAQSYGKLVSDHPYSVRSQQGTMRNGVLGTETGLYRVDGGRLPIAMDDRRMAEALVTSLPSEYLAKDFLKNVDLRVLLKQQLDANPQDALSSQRELVVTAITDVLTLQANASLAQEDMAEDPVAQTIVNEVATQHLDGKAYRTPVRASEIEPTGRGQSSSTSPESGVTSYQSLIDQVGGTGTATTAKYQYLNREQLGRILDLSEDLSADVFQLARTQAQVTEEDRLGYTEDEFGNRQPFEAVGMPESVDVFGRTGTANRTNATTPGVGAEFEQTRNNFSFAEAMRVPDKLTRQELLKLQARMNDAGIFDAASGLPAIPGDATDPRFKRAWSLLLGMAAQKKKPVTEVLGQAMINRQAALGDIARNVVLTDPALLRSNSNALGRRLLGRRLSDEENAQLVDFVHELERKNARVQAEEQRRAALGGIPDPTIDTPVTTQGKRLDEELERSEELAGQQIDPDLTELDDGDLVLADINARLEEELRRRNPVESEANEIAQQYETFTTLLGGPGRF